MLIGFISAKGSPGVTTTVLALASAWPRTAIAVDADPAGGDIAAGLGRGAWPPRSHLVELATQARITGIEIALRRLAVRPEEHAPLALAGLGSPVQSMTMPWRELGHGLNLIKDGDVLCDGGRFVHGHEGNAELLRACKRLVVVTGSSLPAVRSTARLIEVLRVELPGPEMTLLVVAPGRPYDADEIGVSCGISNIVTLPFDARAAAVWSSGAPPWRSFDRSPLQRAARHVPSKLAGQPVVLAP